MQDFEKFGVDLKAAILAKGLPIKAREKKIIALVDGDGVTAKRREKRLRKMHAHACAELGYDGIQAIDPATIKKFLEKLLAIIQAILPLLALI